MERLTKQISGLDVDSPVGCDMVGPFEEKVEVLYLADGSPNAENGAVEASESSTSGSGSMANDVSPLELRSLDQDDYSKKEHNGSVALLDSGIEKVESWEEPLIGVESPVTDNLSTKHSLERRLPNSVLPFLRYQQCESSESSSR